MAVRNTMAALIARVRLLVNDPAGTNQIFADQDVQDILDEGARLDLKNVALEPKPTFTGSTIQYLDYYHHLENWEDDVIFKQYLTVTVTPSVSEPIAGHWQFATTTLPPVFISGKTYDLFRAAADLLERWAARYMTRFDFSSDSQSFKVSQVSVQMQALAKTYRMKQRPGTLSMTRSDLGNTGGNNNLSLAPTAIDYLGSGDGR